MIPNNSFKGFIGNSMMQPDSISYSFQLLGFIVALLICALFSFLETTVTALRLFKLKQISTTTPPRYQKLLETLEARPHQVLITILIAASLANVTAAALITTIMENIFTNL